MPIGSCLQDLRHPPKVTRVSEAATKRFFKRNFWLLSYIIWAIFMWSSIYDHNMQIIWAYCGYTIPIPRQPWAVASCIDIGTGARRSRVQSGRSYTRVGQEIRMNLCRARRPGTTNIGYGTTPNRCRGGNRFERGID